MPYLLITCDSFCVQKSHTHTHKPHHIRQKDAVKFSSHKNEQASAAIALLHTFMYRERETERVYILSFGKYTHTVHTDTPIDMSILHASLSKF